MTRITFIAGTIRYNIYKTYYWTSHVNIYT